MSARRLHQVGQVVERLAEAAHGEQSAIVRAACEQLRISEATFYRYRQMLYGQTRKRRADAGACELPWQEAFAISTYLMESYKRNKHRIVSVERAVDTLRANNAILAGSIDPETGEFKPLSMSAIHRALRHYAMHPDQLRQPSPHIKLKSLHPNHVWQVDGSVCVLYYLPGGGNDLVELDEAVHYKNKPENLKAIEKCRVIRLVMTDHATDATLWRYYPHAETAEHTVRFLAWCMAPKSDPKKFPVNGVPKILMVDPGATSGGLVKRFCDRVHVELIVNERRRPRAKGGVEKGQHRVEVNFEQGLRFARHDIKGFDDLNRCAELFQVHYNATQTHSRHGYTRFDAWNFIRAEHFIQTGPIDTLLALATESPVSREVSGNLSVQFKGRTWSVADVPGLIVGGKVDVHWHPFIANTAMAITYDADGREVHHQLPDVTGDIDPYQNAWGFQKDAAIIGEERKSRPDTLADTHRKAMARHAAGEKTQDAADKKRERKDYVPFGGAIDPFIRARTETTPDYLPKRGNALDAATPAFQPLKLNPVQAARWLKTRLGDDWEAQSYARLMERFPDGATEPELENYLRDAQTPRPTLTLVKA